MSYKEIINNLKPIEYKSYFDDLSFEKFMLYTALTLEEMGIPLTFSYLCIATYKLFPEKFCFDDEFKEYPAWERLNRTYMHLKYVPKGKTPYISGSVGAWYSFTEFWRTEAKNAKAIIDSGEIQKKTPNKKKNVNWNKQWRWRYNDFLESRWFKEYEETWKFDEILVYSFFQVTPFTQKSNIKMSLNLWLGFAEEDNNIRCVEYIKRFLSTL